MGAAAPAESDAVQEYDADEADDVCTPLQSTFPGGKPVLNIAAVPAASDQGAQPPMSTRRRIASSIASLFTPRTARTARNELGRATLPKVIQALKEMRPDEEIADAGRRLLELCPNHDKVSRATNQGALEAIAAALKMYFEKPEVVVWLLPPLINLSSGDDTAGFNRAATLVSHGVLELVCTVLRAHVAAAAETADPTDVEMRSQIVERCVWAMQHLCRRDHSLSADGSSEYQSEARQAACKQWHARLAAVGAVPAVCDAMVAWPVRTKVQLHGCNLLGTYVSGRYAGEAPDADEPPEVLACVNVVTATLGAAVSSFGPDAPVLGAAIHAISDVACTPGLARRAVAGGAITHVADAMESKPQSAPLQEGCCWAVHQLCKGTDRETREKVGGSAAPRAIVHALKGLDIRGAGNLATMREKACRALDALVEDSAGADERELTLTLVMKDQLSRLEVFKAVVAALKAHRKVVPLIVHACDLLAALCSGNDPYDERKNMASASGVIPAIVNILKKNLKNAEVQDAGRRALIVICYNPELQSVALQSGANPDWSPRGLKPATPGPESNRGTLPRDAAGADEPEGITQTV